MFLVTDCAADLQPEEITNLDITVAPLYIQFPGEELSADKITPDDFYQRLQAMRPDIPTTSLPSPEAFTNIYNELVNKGKKIISIHISSGLSGTLSSAQAAASSMAGNLVHTFDSKTLSGGQRFQVLAAARSHNGNGNGNGNRSFLIMQAYWLGSW